MHTNPDFSTSGLSAVVAEYYAATGKKEGLRPEDITGKAREQVRAIERSIVHYGDTTLFIADQMRKRGPGYASAVAMEEATLLDFNQDRRGGQPKLVAIYPEGGHVLLRQPVHRARRDWVTPEQREGAQAFQRFLAKEITPEVAARVGFRPADPDAKPVAPITAANGVDPAQPKRVLGLPEPRVLALLKQPWREDRKPANVLLVLDTSGSMGDEYAARQRQAGTRRVPRRGRAAGPGRPDDLLRPDHAARADRRRSARTRPSCEQTISRLIAEGGTAFYDATSRGLRDRARRSPTATTASTPSCC